MGEPQSSSSMHWSQVTAGAGGLHWRQTACAVAGRFLRITWFFLDFGVAYIFWGFTNQLGLYTMILAGCLGGYVAPIRGVTA